MKLLRGKLVNKQEYLNQLKNELKDLPSTEVDDIIRDQEEYFREALSSGRAEHQIVQSLGSPAQLAKEVKAEFRVKMATQENRVWPQAKSIFKAILALCILAPFNLLFIMGPFLILCTLLLTLWSVDIALALSAIAVVIAGPAVLLAIDSIIGFTAIFGGLALLGFSVLLICATFYLTSLALKMTVSFLKWNVDFIKNQAK